MIIIILITLIMIIQMIRIVVAVVVVVLLLLLLLLLITNITLPGLAQALDQRRAGGAVLGYGQVEHPWRVMTPCMQHSSTN